MTDKLKNEQRIGRMTFFVAWVVIGVFGTFIGQVLFNSLQIIFSIQNPLFVNSFASVVTFINLSIVGYMQAYAMYRFWDIKMRHWWWLTGLGFAIGNLMLNVLLYFFTWDVTIVLFVGMIMQLGFPGMVQAWLLKSHFKRVWVYVLVACGVGAVNGFFILNLPQLVNSITVLYGASTGLILLWLDHITYEDTGDEMSIAEAQT